MTDVMQGLASEAKKNKFSGIGPNLSDEDVVSVWDNVSAFIEKMMGQQKGVHIPGLGTFTFTQKKLDVGNNKYILIQRPVFQLSEKFAQTHGLHFTKHHTSGQIPVVQLNFAALSFESPFDRDNVEASVKEVLQAMSRSVGVKKNVEFTFAGIGRLTIRDNRVKMKFYKDFLNSMDGSGRLVEALKDRPGTVDSVISNRSPSRPFTSNTLVLPRITQGVSGLAPADGAGAAAMPTIQEDGLDAEPVPEYQLQMEEEPDTIFDIRLGGEGQVILDDGAGDPGDRLEADPDITEITFDLEDTKEDLVPKKAGSRLGSRMSIPMAQATGISLTDDLIPAVPKAGKLSRAGSVLNKSSPVPLSGRRSLSPINNGPASAQTPRLTPLADFIDTQRSKSADRMSLDNLDHPTPIKLPQPAPLNAAAGEKPPTPPASACGHKNAGQELCYLCHQRDRRNIPVSFTEERRRREQEDDRLLQQYQHLKDTEAILRDQELNHNRRHENQKMAAFNLGVSEAIKSGQAQRPTEFHPSYVFQKRPLTPPRFIQQERYFKDLSDQVRMKDDATKKRRADEEFLERLEQVQLAEDLAAQREQYLRDKKDQQDHYKRALSTQIDVRDGMRTPPSTPAPRIRSSSRMSPMTLPNPKIIVPFSKTYPLRIQIQTGSGASARKKTVRFQPLPLPARVPDSNEPIFGKNDMTNEMMAEHRRRAHELYKEQLNTVESRKRDAILKRLTDQREEEDMLQRTKKELRDDRADRFERLFLARKKLEEDWRGAYSMKRNRETEERSAARSPGQLLHEQCDRYKRCGQCKRNLVNCGESNIWRESRYIPGSRLMV